MCVYTHIHICTCARVCVYACMHVYKSKKANKITFQINNRNSIMYVHISLVHTNNDV